MISRRMVSPDNVKTDFEGSVEKTSPSSVRIGRFLKAFIRVRSR